MAKQIYALLVGVNEYSPEVGKLSGCINDVDHFNDYLTSSFDKSNLRIEILKDAKATRGNIIELFRTHLAKAQSDDVALFHFCGHGARWASAKAFHKFYPDGKDEGLVCIDSRAPGGFDLADKELAVLIAEVAKNNPHIAIIMDCCHSGSGTRNVDGFNGLKPRVTHEVSTERPLESYLNGHFANLLQRKEELFIPAGKHILLAACERTQLAQENPADKSGVFTSTLVEVLGKYGSDISYAELFRRCRAAVRTRAENQSPQFEPYNNFNAYAGFLGRKASAAASRYRVYYEKDSQSWKIDAGAVAPGIPTDKGKSIGVALYRDDDPARSVGNASIVSVGPSTSNVQLSFPGETSLSYQAEITNLPVAPLPVYLEGDPKNPKAMELLQSALNDPGADGSTRADASLCAQLGVELTEIAEGTRYAIAAEDGKFVLKQRETNLKIQGTKEYTKESAKRLAPAIRNVAQWEKLLALQNHSTTMNKADVDLVFTETTEDGREHEYPTSEITIDVVKSGNDWRKIKGKIKLTNHTGQPKPLHCLLLYFSSAYGITKLYNDPVPSDGAEATMYEDEFMVPEGMNESIDNFKLIVSTEKVDDFLMAQEDIEDFGKDLTPTRAPSKLTPEKKLAQNEWFTKNLRVRFVRQQDQVGTNDAKLAEGKIVVKGHAKVKAKLSLTAAAIPGRSAAVVPTRSATVVPTRSAAVMPTRSVDEGSDFYKAFERQGMEMVNFFEGTRGDNANILELTDIENIDALKEAPIEVELTTPLSEDERILPFIFDGEHLVLGGDTFKDDEGHTHISIDYIPVVPNNRRSLGGSLKLYFFRTILKRENVNKLRWVEDAAGKKVKYREDGVADKVAAAQNIILLVHGIIGDTELMAKGLWMTGLNSKFDLVLTYDYENLDTSIEETAKKLKKDLYNFGLNDTDNKKLTLLVHSMGGLVARHFIEIDGGNKMVDHLVMCGTPNNGSPFGKIDSARKIMNILTGLAASYLPFMIPFAGPILFALNKSKNFTKTLEQMNPSSEFIKTLNSSEDPGIRYTILAGNIENYQEASDQIFAKFLAKVGKGFVVDEIFGTGAHDIAVRDDSILSVSASRKPAPTRGNVACHHLNYFISEAGQKALTEVAW